MNTIEFCMMKTANYVKYLEKEAKNIDNMFVRGELRDLANELDKILKEKDQLEFKILLTKMIKPYKNDDNTLNAVLFKRAAIEPFLSNSIYSMDGGDWDIVNRCMDRFILYANMYCEQINF